MADAVGHRAELLLQLSAVIYGREHMQRVNTISVLHDDHQVCAGYDNKACR